MIDSVLVLLILLYGERKVWEWVNWEKQVSWLLGECDPDDGLAEIIL